MARLRLLGAAITLATAACHRSANIPRTSPEADQLRWLDRADVQADFREHVEQQHDFRFVGVFGFSFSSEFGLPDTSETRALNAKYGDRRISGTTDVITSEEHGRLLRKASHYARQYNHLLVDYLRDHPDT